MNGDLQRMFLSEDQIKEKVKEAAEWLDKRFEGKNPLIICVLKGSVMFFSDLIRAMNTPVQIDFMTISSYGASAQSNGMPKILMDLSNSVEDRDVILVEDIVDSGNTLLKMRELLLNRGAKSFTSVALLDKPSRRKVDIKADYTCFEVEDEFIVGYVGWSGAGLVCLFMVAAFVV
ncbi:MAG: hypoxanthine phosphoribosyltransferase, partial [Clostridia bacterium]|nr:hypoxanthine phosphoribosyltransferase [Clostridia bacterium]